MAGIVSTLEQHWHCCRTTSSCSTGAQHEPSGAQCEERLLSKHARGSDACECRGSTAACLHKHSCRGCSWRSCTPQLSIRGDSRPSRAHAAHLMPLLSNAWVFYDRTSAWQQPGSRAGARGAPGSRGLLSPQASPCPTESQPPSVFQPIKPETRNTASPQKLKHETHSSHGT